MEGGEPASVDVVIVPVAFKKNNELGQCLDRAREVKQIVAATGLSCWTDMRRTYTPSGKYQYWEEKGVPARIEIGAKELASGTVIVSDLVNKTRHPNGRMIATRSNVKLDDLAEVVQGIADAAKEKGTRRGRGKPAPEGSAKWGAILDMIDGHEDASTLAAAAAAAAADKPLAPLKKKFTERSSIGKKPKAKETPTEDASSKDAVEGHASDSVVSAQEKRSGDIDLEVQASPKKKRRRQKKKKAEVDAGGE